MRRAIHSEIHSRKAMVVYKVAKVTAASIGETKRGFKVFKLQLNNSIWVTKLIPLGKREKEYDTFYCQYLVKENLEFIVGKYITIIFEETQCGLEFTSIGSFDVLIDFKTELKYSKGSAFTSTLPIYDFLIDMKRNIEPDGSIKIKSDFPDMRVAKLHTSDVCFQFDTNESILTQNNINTIFEQFYKCVILPPASCDASNSYYKISPTDAAIVRMNNRVRLSYKATHSGDHDTWTTEVIIKIGEELPVEHARYLKENPNKTEVINCENVIGIIRKHMSPYRFTAERPTYDKQLFCKLRILRKELADDEDVAPFIIFNDATLIEIAQKKPCNNLELSKLKLFHKGKISRYGEKVTNLIQNHLKLS